MNEQINSIKEAALDALAKISDLKDLDELRVKLLGKKGEVTQLLKGMGQLSPEERPTMGQMVNELRTFVEDKLDEAKIRISGAAQDIRLKAETIDVTMPGRAFELGHKHPMTSAMDELKNLFIGMGYEIVEGPEIETEFYNFEALNIPENHPCRDEQDTFYTEGGFLLRTQTSPVQIRTMQVKKPPIRIIAPGRVFRSDTVDATHSPSFYQLEGLVVDKGITMGDLKGSLEEFARALFGEKTKTRFRPHHFPFTEPSAEMDVSCWECGGKGCRVCKDEGWIELLGCGMVHPDVLDRCGIDPKIYSGFAFGMGIERVAMARYGINDMRLMYENDIRFLRQF